MIENENLPEAAERQGQTETEKPGRGAFMAAAWGEMKTSRDVSLPLPQVENLLNGDNQQGALTRGELAGLLRAYFETKIQTVVDAEGNTSYYWTSPPLKSELSLVLGISPRTIARYIAGEYEPGRPYQGQRERRISQEDTDLLQRAMTIIEGFYEQKLTTSRTPAGAIFWLLNASQSEWTNDQKLTVARDEETPYSTPVLNSGDVIEMRRIRRELQEEMIANGWTPPGPLLEDKPERPGKPQKPDLDI